MKHYLESVDLTIYFKNGLNITSDALNLVEFIKKEIDNTKGLALDIGAGIGTLTFLLSKVKNFEKIYCVEIQKEVFKILEYNIKINNLKNVIAFNMDIKNMLIKENFEKFEYIFSNPPFYKINSGKLPNDEILSISKFEVKLNLKEFLDASYYLLKKNAFLFFIFPKSREHEILKDKRFKLIKKIDINYSKKSFCIYKLEKIVFD